MQVTERRQRTRTTPVVEQIATDASESFLWRLDDYPWERNVWNVYPEFEIHLVRKRGGVALVGDHIEPFEPGHLSIVGSYLPHDWVATTRPGELISGRDIVVQFDPERVRRATESLPELSEVSTLLERAGRGLAFVGDTRREGAEMVEAMGEARGLDRLAMFFRLLACLSKGESRNLSSTGFSPDLNCANQSWIQPQTAGRHVLAKDAAFTAGFESDAIYLFAPDGGAL